MAYALFGALLTTLALVPGLAYYAYRKPAAVYHNRWLEWLTHRYEHGLAACIEHVGVDGFTAAEANATITSGLARGKTQPRTHNPRSAA